MPTFWFCLVAMMIAGYVVLDGYDLGAGIVHLLVARTDAEKRAVLASIGPFWDGNEVWLLAGGGTLYFAFPALYASSFSGFYLPLMIVLWLLIVRGISIEFRSHLDSPVWQPLWDAGFTGASLLLAIFYGAALGNVVRGVPLDSSGTFFLPLWTDLRASTTGGILDWYTILAGVTAFLALTVHGALWLALKCESPLRERASALARRTWWTVAVATLLISVASFAVQPHLAARFAGQPWGWIFPIIALAGLIGILVSKGPETEFAAFLSSCAYLIGMLTSAAFGVYPLLLPSSMNPAFSLTIDNAAAPEQGLAIGLIWWIPGMILAGAYAVFTYRRFAGKVSIGSTSALH